MNQREQERHLREQAQKAHDHMQQALSTAEALPPLTGLPGGAVQPCATCGQPAASGKKMDDGTLVPICGPCSLREMDEYEAAQRQRER